jgi:hypothetical protein
MSKKTTFEEKKAPSRFQLAVWELVKKLGKPLFRDREQLSIKEQLWEVESKLRQSRNYRFKMIGLMFLCGYLPYEMRRSFENGNPEADNVIALIQHSQQRSTEKKQQIDNLFRLK